MKSMEMSKNYSEIIFSDMNTRMMSMVKLTITPEQNDVDNGNYVQHFPLECCQKIQKYLIAFCTLRTGHFYIFAHFASEL